MIKHKQLKMAQKLLNMIKEVYISLYELIYFMEKEYTLTLTARTNFLFSSVLEFLTSTIRQEKGKTSRMEKK